MDTNFRRHFVTLATGSSFEKAVHLAMCLPLYNFVMHAWKFCVMRTISSFIIIIIVIIIIINISLLRQVANATLNKDRRSSRGTQLLFHRTVFNDVIIITRGRHSLNRPIKLLSIRSNCYLHV